MTIHGMISQVTFELLAMVALFVISAFCSSAEVVFFSLDPLRLRRVSQRHARLAHHLHNLLAQPTRLLSAILITNTVVNVVVSAIGFLVIEHFIHGGQAENIAIAAMTVLLLIFGEFGPKRLALIFTDRLIPLYVPLTRGLVWLTTPVQKMLDLITKRIEKSLRPRGRSMSDEEYETAVDIGREEGILRDDELAMVKAITGLEDQQAADIMTPRVDLRGFDLDDLPPDPVAYARESRRKYLLLYRKQIDNVEGFLDVLKYLLDPDHRVETARIPPFFVPESSPLNRVLSQLQSKKQHVAVVVDEYGGVAGVVTRGVILEKIAGDIYTELSKPRPIFQEAGPHRWLVDANFSLEDLNRKLRLALEWEGAERLAGWIAGNLGHLPEPNEVVEAQGCRVTVLQTDKRRVTLAQIEIQEHAR